MYGPDDYDDQNGHNTSQITGQKKKKSSGGFQSMGICLFCSKTHLKTLKKFYFLLYIIFEKAFAGKY
jgi:hypothetical protein